MKIKIRYFGKLTDLTEKEEEDFSIENTTTVLILEEKLFQRYSKLKTETFAIFRNNSIINNKKIRLEEFDEISLMPPFSGG